MPDGAQTWLGGLYGELESESQNYKQRIRTATGRERGNAQRRGKTKRQSTDSETTGETTTGSTRPIDLRVDSTGARIGGRKHDQNIGTRGRKKELRRRRGREGGRGGITGRKDGRRKRQERGKTETGNGRKRRRESRERERERGGLCMFPGPYGTVRYGTPVRSGKNSTIVVIMHNPPNCIYRSGHVH